MATIEIDIVTFVFGILLGPVCLIFVLVWAGWKAHKNPEFFLKLRKVGYVYVQIWNGLNQLVTIVLPLKDIGENGEFRIMKSRRYYWMKQYKALPPDVLATATDLPAIPKKAIEPDPLKDGLPTTYTWKGRPAALFEWDDPMPQVRVPGGSLHSMTNPRMLDALGAAKDFQLMLQADDLLKLMRMSIFVALIVLVAIAGLGFGLFTVNSTLGHQSCVLSHLDNSTAAQVLCR